MEDCYYYFSFVLLIHLCRFINSHLLVGFFFFKKLKLEKAGWANFALLCISILLYESFPAGFFCFFCCCCCWPENWLSSHGKNWAELGVTKKRKNIFKLLVKDQPKRDLGMFRRTDTLNYCIRLVSTFISSLLILFNFWISGHYIFFICSFGT